MAAETKTQDARLTQKIHDAYHEAREAAARTRADLVQAALGLSEHMKSVAAAASRDDGRGSINSLGEVQGRGALVDTLCAKLRAQETFVAELERVARLAGAL